VIPPSEEWQLNTCRIGRRVLVFDRVDSTSTIAAELGQDRSHDGVVVLAKEQTQGRGQHGRSWQCLSEAGVLLSVLLFPSERLSQPAVLTAWAAVSVCEMIRATTNLQGRIKWPNDVLIRGRKVCGILIEQSHARGQVCTVAGMGLNLNQMAEDFTAVGLPEASSLRVFTGQVQDWAASARSLIEHLDAHYELLVEGDLTTLEACWKWRIGLLGKRVVAESHQGMIAGRLLDVGWDHVVVEVGPDEIRRLRPEAVQHLRPE
jgi:BirA family biotin operon repressor/biotin-[acetyl-CoA-carboxylase] ligase